MREIILVTFISSFKHGRYEYGRAYNNLHGEEETGCWLSRVPMKYALVRNIHTRVCFTELLLLQIRQVPTDLNDIVCSPIIHLGILVADMVQYIECQRSVSCTDLVNDEIFVWKVFEQIF